MTDLKVRFDFDWKNLCKIPTKIADFYVFARVKKDIFRLQPNQFKTSWQHGPNLQVAVNHTLAVDVGKTVDELAEQRLHLILLEVRCEIDNITMPSLCREIGSQ